MGLSFEMTVFATDVSVDVDVPDGNDSSALRERAAVENAALEALHWFSLQEEIAITEGAVSRNSLFAGTTSGSDGFALDADFVQVLPMTDSAHDVSVLEGYSADMRSATQDPDWSHKAFNTSGSLVFWNDLFDPSKTFLSSFDTTSNVLLILFREMFMKLLNTYGT